MPSIVMMTGEAVSDTKNVEVICIYVIHQRAAHTIERRIERCVLVPHPTFHLL
jgi:hypothetical protein